MRRFFNNSEVLSNIVNLGLGDLGSRVLSFVAFIYVARVLGPENLGLISFGASAALLVSPLIDYGLGFVGTREVSKRPDALKYYIKTIFFNRFVLGIIALLCLVVAAMFLSDPEKGRIVLLYAATLLPAMFTLTWAYQGIGDTWWFPVEKILQAVLFLGGLLLVVRMPADLERVPVTYALSALIPAMIVLAYYGLKLWHVEGTLDFKRSGSLLKSSFKLFVPTFLSQVNLSIALLMIVWFSSLSEAGYFTAASKIIVLTASVPNLLWSSFYPILARDTSASVSEIRSSGSTLYKYTILIGILPAFIGIVFSRDLVTLLFGSSYEGAMIPFQLFSVVASLQFLSIVFTRILPAFGKESSFSRIVTGGTILQIAGCAILVPAYGAAGAAWSFIISECLIAGAALALVSPLIGTNLLKQPAISLGLLMLCYLLLTALRMLTDVSAIVCLVAVLCLYFTILLFSSVITLRDFLPRKVPIGEAR